MYMRSCSGSKTNDAMNDWRSKNNQGPIRSKPI